MLTVLYYLNGVGATWFPLARTQPAAAAAGGGGIGGGLARHRLSFTDRDLYENEEQQQAPGDGQAHPEKAWRVGVERGGFFFRRAWCPRGGG